MNPVVSAFLGAEALAKAARRKFWILAPLAAAAILVLALVLPSRTPRTVVNPVATVVTTKPATQPLAAPGTSPASAQVPPQTVVARATRRPAQTGPTVRATVAADDAGADVRWVAPLAAPAEIAVGAIEPAPEPAIPAIDLAPTEIPALEVRPISDTPRERRNQE
jgi:hypothetical protein